MINKGLFTSNTPEWETPQALFDELDKEFNFELDVCANKNNKKCDNYYNKIVNGLEKEWHNMNFFKNACSVWCNPPYGREIGKWVKKASEESDKWRFKSIYKVVMLLPARTDTRWFHEYIYKQKNVEIRFLKGRLKFGNSKNSAPFPSMIVIFY